MSDFSVYWSNARVQALKGLPGDQPLTVLFGGDHTSQPSFLRAKVQPGDRLHIISVSKGKVWLHAAATVATLSETRDIHPAEFQQHVDMAVTEEWIAQSGWPRPIFFASLCVTCTSEALTLTDSLGPFAPRPLDETATKNFTFLNQRGTRRPKGVEDGTVRSPLAFQGIYRLAPATAEALNALARAT